MEIKIYVDVLFFTNFLMDYALLYLSAKIIKRKLKFRRHFLSATLGALLGVFSFFIPLSAFWNNSLKITVGVLMTLIAFGPRSIISAIKLSSVFFALCLCCGGLTLSLLYCTNLGARLGTVVSGGTIYLNIPIYKILLCCTLCYGLIASFLTISKKYRNQAEFLCDVTIYHKGKSVQLKALFDSGNTLFEPVSGLSVLVVRKEALSPLSESGNSADNFLVENKNNIINIPYKTVSGLSQMKGFMPDKTEVNKKEIKVYVAICETNLSENFDALIPCNLHERIE